MVDRASLQDTRPLRTVTLNVKPCTWMRPQDVALVADAAGSSSAAVVMIASAVNLMAGEHTRPRDDLHGF
jgi:hypothetical protein